MESCRIAHRQRRENGALPDAGLRQKNHMEAFFFAGQRGGQTARDEFQTATYEAALARRRAADYNAVKGLTPPGPERPCPAAGVMEREEYR